MAQGAREEAAPAADQASAESAQQRLKHAFDDLAALGLPLGWDSGQGAELLERSGDSTHWPTILGEWLLKLTGFLFTALAASLGAPFWFDTLNRFMIVRATVKPTEKSPNEPPVDQPRRIPVAN